jgi:hypothetical protein
MCRCVALGKPQTLVVGNHSYDLGGSECFAVTNGLTCDVQDNREWLDNRAFFERYISRELLAVVLRQTVVPRKLAVSRRRSSREDHVGTEVVVTFFATNAAAARCAGFHTDAVSHFERGHGRADFGDDAG